MKRASESSRWRWRVSRPPEAMLRHEYIEAVYTAPQIAQIGPVRELPSDVTDNEVAVLRRPFNAALLARIDHADDGLLKVWVQRSDGRILGAVRSPPFVRAPVALSCFQSERVPRAAGGVSLSGCRIADDARNYHVAQRHPY